MVYVFNDSSFSIMSWQENDELVLNWKLYGMRFYLFLLGCIAVTSAEDGGAETTQYLILQGPDDGKWGVPANLSSFNWPE